MKYFLDIMPTVFDTFGAPHTLGPARYEVDDELVGKIWTSGPIRYLAYQPLTLSTPDNGAAPARVTFELTLWPADAPQPSPVLPMSEAEMDEARSTMYPANEEDPF